MCYSLLFDSLCAGNYLKMNDKIVRLDSTTKSIQCKSLNLKCPLYLGLYV